MDGKVKPETNLLGLKITGDSFREILPTNFCIANYKTMTRAIDYYNVTDRVPSTTGVWTCDTPVNRIPGGDRLPFIARS